MARTKYTIEIVIEERRRTEAQGLVEDVLDIGDLQDAINSMAKDLGYNAYNAKVTSALLVGVEAEKRAKSAAA